MDGKVLENKKLQNMTHTTYAVCKNNLKIYNALRIRNIEFCKWVYL